MLLHSMCLFPAPFADVQPSPLFGVSAPVVLSLSSLFTVSIVGGDCGKCYVLYSLLLCVAGLEGLAAQCRGGDIC